MIDKIALKNEIDIFATDKKMMLRKDQILYEDNHLLIVNKQAGLLVQGDKTGDTTLADYGKAYIKERYNKPGDVFLGVVHRIDRPVSGIVALARTSKGLERMNVLFRDQKIKKTYWAVVKNKPPFTSGELVHYLKKNTKINKTTAFNKPSGGAQKAVLNYKLIGRIGEYYLLQIEPLTGRPHQIRVQLAKMGTPIVGDVKYGFDTPNKDGSIHLHAKRLEFIHPVKNTSVNLVASLPNDQIWNLFKNL